jgi:hypothetical protein
MRKKYCIVTFGPNQKYERCFSKVRAQTMEEARNKFLSINPSYDRIDNSTVIARVKELKLKYISLEQIKKETIQ